MGVIILAQSCGGEGDNINLYGTLQGCGVLWSQVLVVMCNSGSDSRECTHTCTCAGRGGTWDDLCM